tara:strand:- start:1809 stop:4247 length:2439 start_codon:yes stop_codon:yes gene_type:complete
MNNQYNKGQSSFPDPLASTQEKLDNSYGLQYAKAMFAQWVGSDYSNSLYGRRNAEIERCRDYAQGTQDTSIYRKILNSLDPNGGGGTLLTLDYTPVPIVPKFVKIVVNKILSRAPYPNIEAIDPLSRSEKDKKKNATILKIENKDILMEAQSLGLDVDVDPASLPETPEETEIFIDTNVKTDAEIAAQLATEMTLKWNDFGEAIYRRCVEDLAVTGLGIARRSNDPNYGIKEEYVDPAKFVHNWTDDPNFTDLTYAGNFRYITIMELKRVAGDQFTESQYEEIAKTVMNKYGNQPDQFSTSTQSGYSRANSRFQMGYDEYKVEVLEFEFMSVDDIIFEKKESAYGNIGFYHKGTEYNAPQQSVYDREAVYMSNASVYGGTLIVGTDHIYNYGPKKNIPKNVHDISRARLSYSIVATNIRGMIPKSMVSSVIGFADMLQITHLKIQQSIAKAKPDGLIIDIEGLENVQLGKGGSLEPLEIQDIYEQTGVFYYRSKNPEGGFQNPPVREIGNAIRNIGELVNIYNHYLRMIRDATGINEVMDGTTPKGDALVGVREQAMSAGNNAIYDITNAAHVLYKKVCDDIVRCLQIIPKESILYNIYTNAVGETNMAVLSSFDNLGMYNFGVMVVTEMNDSEKAYLEQNIQIALGQKEIDLEDAIAIRQLRDVEQAERLLVVRRAKRIKSQQEQAQQQMQMQTQMNAQSQQMAAQAEMEKEQMRSQLEIQRMQLEGQIKTQLMELEYQYKMQIEQLKGQYDIVEQEIESGVRQAENTESENRKDERIDRQAMAQSKLIAQRKGDRPPLDETLSGALTNIQ